MGTFGNCLSSKAGAVEEEAESILRLRPRHQHNGHAVSLADHCSALSPLCLCGSSFLHDGQRLGAHSGLQWVLRQPNLQVEKKCKEGLTNLKYFSGHMALVPGELDRS